MLHNMPRGYSPPWRHPRAARQAIDGIIWIEDTGDDFAARVLAAHVLRRLACWRGRGRHMKREG